MNGEELPWKSMEHSVEFTQPNKHLLYVIRYMVLVVLLSLKEMHVHPSLTLKSMANHSLHNHLQPRSWNDQASVSTSAPLPSRIWAFKLQPNKSTQPNDILGWGGEIRFAETAHTDKPMKVTHEPPTKKSKAIPRPKVLPKQLNKSQPTQQPKVINIGSPLNSQPPTFCTRLLNPHSHPLTQSRPPIPNSHPKGRGGEFHEKFLQTFSG
jgi:hypothetical protein